MMYAGIEYTVQIQTQQDLYNLKLNIQKTKIIAKRWGAGNQKTGTGFIFLGSKIIADGDYNHEIKRQLLLEIKAMTNLGSILKSRDILCQKRSIESKLWFFQRLCMDMIGP